MKIDSLNSLALLADRVEALAHAIRDLHFDRVTDPAPPHVLSLDSVSEWLASADEARRKPRVARSKRLLSEANVDTPGIPVTVLEHDFRIADITAKLRALPDGLQAASARAVGAALTNDIDDAMAVIESFSEAAEAIRLLEKDGEAEAWVRALVSAAISANPSDASVVLSCAREVTVLNRLAARYRVTFPGFASLDEALRALTSFDTALKDYGDVCASEDLPLDAAAVDGLDLHTATTAVRRLQQGVKDEKAQAFQRVAALEQQMQSLGIGRKLNATTLREMREIIPETRAAIEARQAALRNALGSEVYRVVDVLAHGALPPDLDVDDSKLGAALRKAVAAGYRVHLEVPREDQ